MIRTILSNYVRYSRFIASCRLSVIRSSCDILAAAALLVSVSSCSDDVNTQSHLVMEAWIDSGGYPVVLLTRSLSPSASETDVAETMVRWGRVTISDGERTVNMIGGPDHSVFPPFSYRTYDMAGEVGRTYTVVAEYEGMRVQAASAILEPPEISRIGFDHVSDSVFSGYVTFTAAVDADTSRYMIFTRVRNDEYRHYPAFLGSVTAYAAGQRCTAPLYRGKHVDALGEYQANFCLGDTVDVIVARVEPDVYDFWQGYQDEVYFGNNIFISSVNPLYGNVEGGYGVFSARGVARREVVVTN